MKNSYDVVVIGGGAAGLNGALMLTRSRRSVLVIDGGQPRNAPATGVHGLLGHDGLPPGELLERGRREVRSYGGEILTGEVEAVGREQHGFTVRLADGQTVTARRLLVASGLVDELPDVPGLRERWGKDVLHCPYCHGWEARDAAIGVLATGPMSVHQALLFRQLSDDVVFFAGIGESLPGEQREQLRARDIRIVEGDVASVEVVDDRIAGVRLRDGSLVPRTVIAVATSMVARAKFLAPLGLHAVPHPAGIGEYIPAEPGGRREVPGVWVAGNVSDLRAQVGGAAAAGAMAGAEINADLVMAETDLAIAAARATIG
jgi:thioredoxin reductase